MSEHRVNTRLIEETQRTVPCACNYVDVNYAGRVVSYLASVALKKTKRSDYDSIYTRIVYISSLDNMACEGVAKDPRKSSNLRQNFRV